MDTPKKSTFNAIKTLIFVMSIPLSCITTATHANAQEVISSGSDTVVTPPGSSYVVTGGIQSGANLFHSFDTFSPDQYSVTFDNTSMIPGLPVERIFARILNSGSGSFINNMIELSLPNSPATLFLIDPQGLTFGENAKLGTGLSLFGSTAEAIQFTDGSQFSTVDSSAPPPLTVSIPTSLHFVNMASGIEVVGNGHGRQSSLLINSGASIHSLVPVLPSQGLTVEDGGTLTLVGGNITSNGGNLVAPQGQIYVGSVGVNTSIDLDSNLIPDYTNTTSFQDINLNQKSSIDASGDGGGSIQVQGRNISLSDGSLILSRTNGTTDGQDVEVRATETLNIAGTDSSGFVPSGIITQTEIQGVPGGAGGNVQVSASSITATRGGVISTTTFEDGGAGGNVNVDAQSIDLQGTSIGLSGPSAIFAESFQGGGPGGDISINTKQLIVREQALISTEADVDASSGNIQIINAQNVTVDSGSRISSAVVGSSGTVGSILIDSAQTTLSRDGNIFTSTEGSDDAGQTIIRGEKLQIFDGSQITAGTFGSGAAGPIQIEVDEVVIDGTGNFPSRITSQVGSPLFPNVTGQGGEIVVKAKTLQLSNGGQLSTSTFAQGDGGRIQLDVTDSINVIGTGESNVQGTIPSTIASQVTATGSGDAGQIDINTNTLQVSDRGLVSVENRGTGNAGNLNINARYIKLNNNASITGATTSGQGGNLDLDAMHIIMLFDSEISTTAGTSGQPGDGGNITIDAATVTGLFNSDIASNSFQGRGGRIVITAQGIFGLEFRLARTPGNDITAFSLTDPQLNGEVVLNTPDIDPTQALIEVPVVESPEVVERVCRVGVGSGRGSDGTLMVQGRALPSSPTDAPGVGRILLRELNLSGGSDIPNNPTPPTPQRSARDRLIAQRIGQNAQGQLALTAQAATPTALPVLLSAVQC
ncbi:MAG: hypothetical protein AAGG51_07325 [Cyanobacteria bacterium P01_G01_bin.54]